MEFIPGNPMSHSAIVDILSKHDLIVGAVMWDRLINCDAHTVAQYETSIYGENVFLHLMSYEMTNYWIISSPHKDLKEHKDGIRLYHYDLISITELIMTALNSTQEGFRPTVERTSELTGKSNDLLDQASEGDMGNFKE